MAVADVNGDGKPDIVVANVCDLSSQCVHGGTVGVLLGNGDGTFQAAVTYASGAYNANSVAVADVNGDGKPDLVVANVCSTPSNCVTGSVSVLLGNGDGTFQTATTYESGGFAEFVAVADVNGDGKPDLLLGICGEFGASGCDSGDAGVLLGNGDGTFQTVVTYGSGGFEADSLAVADLNGDGKPDLAVANGYGVGVLLGNGDGTFRTAVTSDLGSGPATAVGDVNGDGKPDLLVGDGCNLQGCFAVSLVGVSLGNGDGTFQTALTYGSGGSGPASAAVVDVNGDGKPDLVVANSCAEYHCYTDGTVGVLINTGKPGTTIMLASSQNPSNFGQAVTFTATVTAEVGTPTGTVSFYDGTTNIGNSNLNGIAVATLTTSTLAEGTPSITATYNGDANHGTGTSPVLNQLVQGAVVALSPTSLTFGYQTVGVTSAPQVVMFTNVGNIPLILTSIGMSETNSGDFAQTNNCPGSVAPNGGCTISVTFTPTAGGNRVAAVSIVDNAQGSPQNVPLTGSVRDFSLATNSPTSQTVTPGQAANYTVTISPLNGFAETVSLTCSGAPAQSTCAVAPGSVVLDGSNTVTVNVAVVTAGASMGLTLPPGRPPNSSAFAAWAALTGMMGLALMVGLVSRRPRLAYGLAFLCLLSVGLTLPACGGGGGSSGGGGTPTGTYILTVTGAYPPGSTTLTHKTQLTLIVQ